MEASFAMYPQENLSGQVLTPESSRPSLSNVQSSYSMNDVPTLKNANIVSTNITPPKTHAQQSFHNHNASLGRIPPNAMSNRHSRELSGVDTRREEQSNGYYHNSSALQASAAPFGPATTVSPPVDSIPSQLTQHNGMAFPNQNYYGGYGMQLVNMGMTSMQMANPIAFQNQMQGFQSPSGFSQYPNYGNQGRFQDSQARIIQQRRMQNGEGGLESFRILFYQC